MKLTNNLMEFEDTDEILFIDDNEMRGMYKTNNKIRYFKLVETDINYNVKKKCINNVSLEELKLLMPDMREDIIEIVYGYLHRGRYVNNINYAYKCHISEATLFRYIKKVKEKFNDSL